MSISLQRGTITGTEPITLEQAKLHLRVDFSDDDALILALITAARERAELVTGRALVKGSWIYSLDSFPYGYFCNTMPAPARVTPDKWLAAWAAWQSIELPRSPIVSVDSVRYIPSADGQLATLDPSVYVTDTATEPGRIYPVLNSYWPLTQAVPRAVQITFTAGYDQIPEPIRMAMLLMIGHWYAQREDSADIPHAADALLSIYRVLPLGLKVG